MPESFYATFDDDRERDSERRARARAISHECMREYYINRSLFRGEGRHTLVPFGKWTFVICRGIEYKRVDSCRDDGASFDL